MNLTSIYYQGAAGDMEDSAAWDIALISGPPHLRGVTMDGDGGFAVMTAAPAVRRIAGISGFRFVVLRISSK